MADQKKNLWARSADPEERKKAVQRHDKFENEREMRTKNIVRTSPWQNLRGKDGKMGKK